MLLKPKNYEFDLCARAPTIALCVRGQSTRCVRDDVPPHEGFRFKAVIQQWVTAFSHFRAAVARRIACVDDKRGRQRSGRAVPSPRGRAAPGAGHAARGWLQPRRSRPADRRRREHLDRDRPVQPASAGARGGGEGGIRAAGGTPMEFNTISISDGITMGSPGMRASLVSREVITDSIELVALGNMFDALVVLVGCDKTIPAGGDGTRTSRYPRPDPLRRLNRPRPCRGARRDDPGRVRRRREPRGRAHVGRRNSASSRITPARARGRAAASSPPTRWRPRASFSGSRRWGPAMFPPCTRKGLRR